MFLPCKIKSHWTSVLDSSLNWEKSMFPWQLPHSLGTLWTCQIECRLYSSLFISCKKFQAPLWYHPTTIRIGHHLPSCWRSLQAFPVKFQGEEVPIGIRRSLPVATIPDLLVKRTIRHKVIRYSQSSTMSIRVRKHFFSRERHCVSQTTFN